MPAYSWELVEDLKFLFKQKDKNDDFLLLAIYTPYLNGNFLLQWEQRGP